MGKKAFGRNARNFTNHLNSTIGGIFTDFSQLKCDVTSDSRALIHLVSGQCKVDDGCLISLSMTVAPNPDDPKNKVTTVAYSMALVLGESRDTDWVVRYEYSADLHQDYEMPSRTHMHVNAEHQAYECFIQGRTPGYGFSKLHFPTCRITLEQFLAWVIVELEVPTQGERVEMVERLSESHMNHMARLRTHFG